ncbi:MAG: phosphate ABC transporter ATP-binding protein PstB [Candidatus Omnitrophota bacterium]
MEKIIEIKKLNLWFGEKHILKDIDLDFQANEISAIIGPSGCGKSTLIRTLNRMNDLIPETRIEGGILLDGQDIYDGCHNVVNLRTKVGMVFQRPNPFPKSIFENVAYGLRVQGIHNRREIAGRVENTLKAAALWNEVKDNLNQNAFQLSGGQQQRLCIARALAIEPEVILFDEPCSALDPISTARIEELLLKLKISYTIIIVTHNMQQAARVADTTAFLLMGEMIEVGATSQIFKQPKDKRTEDYITGRFG